MEGSVKTSPTTGFNLDSENTTQYNIILGIVDSFLAYLAAEITIAGQIEAAGSPLLLLPPTTFVEAACQRW